MFNFSVENACMMCCVIEPHYDCDVVFLHEDEAFVKSEFAKINFVWDDQMTSMLGNTYKVLPKFIARGNTEIIALPSPDGSQNGQWYFPKSVITKIGTYTHPTPHFAIL